MNNVGLAVQIDFADVLRRQWDAMWQLNVMSYVRRSGPSFPACGSAATGGS